MIRGTTPTLNFTLPFNCSEMTACFITFSQNNRVVLEKKLTDCTTSQKVLTLCLTESETLLLDCNKKLEMQIRCNCNGTKMASNIMSTDVGRILKEGCL